MSPLTDELPEDVKAQLAQEFAELRRAFLPLDVEQQRFLNRTWNNTTARWKLHR